jgi:phage shock protein PspC (stress-responsive transcriptional regulator)
MKRVSDQSGKRGIHRGTARYFVIAVTALVLLFVISILTRLFSAPSAWRFFIAAASLI